jgi:A/G-specific adenine glycosylase
MHPFASKLIQWYRIHKRDLPWRDTSDPYPIWLSETILQQTRVAQGLPYYERFLNRYPTLDELAKANDDDVMKLWQGLGYYSRARNMLKAARYIHNELKGAWPKTAAELKKLSGIGPYTSAAIASFAFGESVPVIDGNVYRVVSRYLDISSDIAETAGKKDIETALKTLFDTNHPAEFNQAIMDLGATVCTPKNPDCESCPVSDSCQALKAKTVHNRPVKTKKTKVLNRYIELFVFTHGNEVGFVQRPSRGVWSNLWTFPFIELESEYSADQVLQSDGFRNLTSSFSFKVIRPYNAGIHLLSHRKLHLRYWEIEMDLSVSENDPPFSMISWDELHTFAVPKPIETFLKKRDI